MRFIVGALVAWLATTASPAWAACTAPACTKVIDNGPDAAKRVLVVLGDGYAAADQVTYNGDVDNMVVEGLFGNDFFRDHQNAFNVYRLNLVSAQSGMSRRIYDEHGTPKDATDDTVVSTIMKNTALKIIYSGSWAHCWLEYSAQTEVLLQSALTAYVPNADNVLIILNEDSYGGCGGNGRQHVPRGVSWSVVAHEAGHGIGGLKDEYGGPGAYMGPAVNNRNCSTVLDRSTVFWNRFIDPLTPVPTTFMPGMDSNKTVGEFEGCATKNTGIYRPVHKCRMRESDAPNFCPVCQTLMRKDLYPNLDHDFSATVTGDFNGDGRSDVLVHNGNDIAIYQAKSTGKGLDQVWIANNAVPSAPNSNYFWTMAPGDTFHVADFDGDGKDDVFVFNGTSWNQTWIGLPTAPAWKPSSTMAARLGASGP